MSLALVAGETGVATLAVVVVSALVLLMTAKVWRTAPNGTVHPSGVGVPNPANPVRTQAPGAAPVDA